MAGEPPLQPLVVPPGAVSAPPAPLVPLGLPNDLVLGGPGPGHSGASPAISAIQRNLMRNFGMNDEARDPMTGATAAPLSPFLEMVQKHYPADRPLPRLMPEFAGGIDPYPQAERAPVTVDWTSTSLAMRTGLDESPLGSLLRVDQLRKAMSMHSQPGYEIWNDRQITDAGFGNQMFLFTGSQSRDMTTWMIDRLREKARMGEYIEAMGPIGAVAQFAGGILGDPLTYLPATLGLKSSQLATKMAYGALNGAELKLLSSSGVFWGSVADTLANISLTAGTHVASRMAQSYVDPASQLDDVLDSLFLPVALAGSAQFVTSVFARRAAHGLKDEVLNPGFLRGTAASGARYVPDDFIGPVVHPTDEAAAALSSRYDDIARRMERVEKGLEDPRVRLAGDSDYVAGKFGKQDTIPFNGLPRNGAFAPGSLATNYGPMRTAEALRDPATAAIVGETADFRTFSQGNKLFELRGGTFQAYHGTGQYFDDFSNIKLGSATSADSARLGHFFASTPEAAGTYAGWEYGFEAGRAPQIRPAYLRMTNPLLVTSANVGEITGTAAHKLGTDDYAAAIAAAKARGHDGVIFRRDPGSAKYDSDHYVVFDPKGQIRHFDQRYGTGRTPEEAGSVGAALNPASQIYRREALLAQNRMAPTGIGMENLPLDPVARTFQGWSTMAMMLVSDLVATGGRLTVGNLMGRTVGTRAPVEQLIEANWGKPVVDLVRRQHDSWHEYKKALAKAGGQTGIQPVDYATRTNMDRLMYEVGQAALDLIARGDPGISFNAFRNRVAKALRNGDVDELTDSATVYVNREASAQRAFYGRTRDLANQHGIFDEAYEKARDLALSEVRALKKEADDVARKSRLEKWDPARTRQAEEALIARTEDAQFRLRQTEQELEKLRRDGPTLNGTAPSYLPRLWDVGELTRLENEFVSEISDWLIMKSKGTLDTAEAVRITKEIHNLVSRQNPVYDRGDMEALFKSVASPGSAMARSLTIPDKMIEKYLINDSEVLLRYHARQMGTAIEFKQRFGSLDLKEQIAEVQQEYRALMRRAEAEAASPPSSAEKAAFEAREGVPWSALPPVADIEKMMNGAIDDMQVLRDRLYGTHGASADPHNWGSRTIRMAKQFANITLLGMSGVSSLGDFVRPLMTEGLDAMYGYGLRSLMSDSRGTILALSRRDMELAGTGMDLMNNVRALQAADTGDVFASRGRLEHGLNQANNWFFVANGLNQLTEWSKRWSSIMIQGRMNKAIEEFAATGRTTDPTDLARLASFNIDDVMARRIALQLKIHGKTFDDVAGFKLADLGRWKDELASEMYKSMLFQSINRTVVTPGVGDRATWMSTELGSLVSQYKAWGVANLTRSLQSGLQEGGNQFWYGAAAAVGFAILLNEVRSRLFYDHSTFDRPATAVIADGVDRSSILGWFSDANRAVETLTGNRLGFRPLMGAVNPKQVDTVQAIGTIGGPAAGQGARAASVLNDFIRDHPTAKTYNNWRTLLPGNTLPYLDPAFDRAISDGNFRKGMERSAEKRKRLLQE